ncbi:MAG: acyltransferase [Candidatus Dormibacteria bacterium]
MSGSSSTPKPSSLKPAADLQVPADSPLARLGGPARMAVRLLAEAIRWRVTVGRGGRFTIGDGFVCNGRIRLAGPGRISIGDGVNAWARAEANVLLTFSSEAEIVIGNNVRLNGAGIQAATRVVVGDDCILGSCTIVDTDHHSVEVDRRRPGARPVSRPITIGRNVWVAGGAAILKGVTIGDDSVIGYGAVVTADVPPRVVVAGNPARVMRRLDGGTI